MFGEITFLNEYTVANLWDANWNQRILQPYERLIIDDLEGTVVGLSAPVDAAIILGTGNPGGMFGSTIICPIDSLTGSTMGAFSVQFFKEGISLPIGVLPAVYNNVAAKNKYRITGNGRIVEGSTQGMFPNWQATANTSGLE